MGILFSVNVYVFIPMVLFLWLKIVEKQVHIKMRFSFRVNVYVYLPMVLSLWLKIVKK